MRPRAVSYGSVSFDSVLYDSVPYDSVHTVPYGFRTVPYGVGAGKRQERMPGQRAQLSREAWTAAALEAIAEGGIAAVAVEPLTRRLGVTKGSFYWHFADRDALVVAALERWERENTEEAIAELGRIEDPRQRLRRLIEGAFGRPDHLFGVLSASADDPRVAPVLQRVTRRRLDFVAECYAALGHGGSDARNGAMLTYSAYVGLAQLLRASSGPTGEDRDGYVAYLTRILVPGEAPTASGSWPAGTAGDGAPGPG